MGMAARNVEGGRLSGPVPVRHDAINDGAGSLERRLYTQIRRIEQVRIRRRAQRRGGARTVPRVARGEIIGDGIEGHVDAACHHLAPAPLRPRRAVDPASVPMPDFTRENA